MSSDIVIRALDPDGVALAVEWAAEEGWNPGIDDAKTFRRADPEGFLGLFTGDVMAACISAVAYDEGFAFIGFYICRKDLRGRGYGRRLWDAALARLGARTIGLDGVVAQQANYAANGFAYAHRNVRYCGNPAIEAPREPALIEVGAGVGTGLPDRIAAYDRPLFPGRRDEFVRRWIDRSSGRCTVAFVARETVRGYGTIRPCRDGLKIGPLFADDGEVAADIFAALVCPFPGARITLDVPEPNEAARALAERHGMVPVFETARMYRGAAPALPLARIFGITSFELG